MIRYGYIKGLVNSAGLILLLLFAAGCGQATLDGELSGASGSEDSDIVISETTQADQEEPEEKQAANEENDNQESVEPVSNTTGLEIDAKSIETDDDGLTVGFTADGHAFRGEPNAPIVIEEYSDYQCPFCSRFYFDTLPSINEDQLATGKAVLVYYDFPLNNIHPQASAAANAARCAGDQGAIGYWAMHDALFSSPNQWSNDGADVIFAGYAEEIGLDVDEFENCLAERFHDEAIEADLDSGIMAGVTGTPSFLINGQLLVGAQPAAVFADAIDIINSGDQLASNEPEPSQDPPAAAPTPAAFEDDYAGAMGDPDAPVTIIEFTDYQCPFCARHSLDTMPGVVREMVETGRVYYILKDLPLDQLHPNARIAAVAARCAGEQEAYWEMHDAVFANQSEWSELTTTINDTFSGYAGDIGLDAADFDACLESGRHDQSVEANATEARSLGVGGTPFFFVDGYPLNGARPLEHFQIAVELAEEGRLAEAFTPPDEPEPQEPTGPQDVPIGDAFSIGDPNAPVTIVEYTDFQCPFCSRHFQETYPQIKENYVDEGLVLYVFKDFPLNNIHPQASLAAQAARCAGDQDAYSEMHDILFARQNEWSGKSPVDIFAGYADELGLDSAALEQCLASETYADAVDADLQEGVQLGVTGTPAFFINGYSVSGAQPYSLFEQAIESLMAEAGG